mgnify:CR=1 FL=1
MRQILEEAKNLICNDGDVCLWKSESLDGLRYFATKDDAQKYIDLWHQLSREKGWKEESYSIGTEDDFMAAAKKHEADKKANEVKEYCKHADALIERRQLEIKALDGLFQVCRQFDGKVLNKRFHDAVKEATGLYSSFTQYSFELGSYSRDYYVEYRPSVMISADWSHGKKTSYPTLQWQWNTGERLEAEKAVAVIEQCKKDRLAVIETLKASKKKYSVYLKLARKAEAIMKEMEGYDYTIREFAKEKALSQYSHHSYFWKDY